MKLEGKGLSLALLFVVMKNNIELMQAAITNLINQIPREHKQSVRRISVGVYGNSEDRFHAHASADVKIRFCGQATNEPLPLD